MNIEGDKLSEKGKTLVKENCDLRGELKGLQETFASLEAEMRKSVGMRERLDGLCKELQKQTKEIKEESRSKIQEAEEQSIQLAQDVSHNIGFMDGINNSLANVSAESTNVKDENEDLATKISLMKVYYDEREKIIENALNEAETELTALKKELALFKLQCAEGKEQIFTEMQRLATGLVEAKTRLRDMKITELALRGEIASYDDKFAGLQTSLINSNSSYEEFRDGMEKVTKETKGLEVDTVKWQEKWDHNNQEMLTLTREHTALQNQLTKIHEGLVKMTSLYKALKKDTLELQGKIEAKNVAQNTKNKGKAQ